MAYRHSLVHKASGDQFCHKDGVIHCDLQLPGPISQFPCRPGCKFQEALLPNTAFIGCPISLILSSWPSWSWSLAFNLKHLPLPEYRHSHPRAWKSSFTSHILICGNFSKCIFLEFWFCCYWSLSCLCHGLVFSIAIPASSSIRENYSI